MNTYIRFWWLMARHKKSPPTEDTTWTEQYFCFGRLHKPATMVVVLAETRNTVWEGVIQYLSIISEWTQVYANMSTPPRYLFIAIKVKLASSSMRGIPYTHVSVLKSKLNNQHRGLRNWSAFGVPILSSSYKERPDICHGLHLHGRLILWTLLKVTTFPERWEHKSITSWETVLWIQPPAQKAPLPLLVKSRVDVSGMRSVYVCSVTTVLPKYLPHAIVFGNTTRQMDLWS